MSTTADLGSLFNASGLDEEGVNALNLTAGSFGDDIQAGLGTVDLDGVDASEVVLVTFVIDDSGSIAMAGNTQTVRDGYNEALTALRESKASGEVLVSCRLLNGEVLYPYVTLDQAVELDDSNYNPHLGTPLYDATATTLATVAAKVSEFEQGGVAVRAVTYVVTDGADVHSKLHRSSQSVEPIVKSLLRTESHIIGAIGIEDSYATVDFNEVFRAMGIPDQWVLTPKNDRSAIRKAFGTASQSAVRASQNAGSFSQTAMGGFGS